jgi:glycosyltransferase involved in cell wall biosynthesis
MINEDPLVSVIVTTFNRKQFLKKCIDSILNQTFTNFELVIVDNYSNYDFFLFINSYNDKRIRAYQNKNNGIIAVNRNFGIRKARGKYIAFCDDDDIWLKEKLLVQTKYFINNTDIDMIYCPVQYFGNTSFFSYYFGMYPLPYRVNEKYIELSKGNSIACSSVMLRKEIIKKVGYFDENSKLISVEDFDLWLRISQYYNIKYINRILVKYRVHNSGIINNINIIKNNLKYLYKKNGLNEPNIFHYFYIFRLFIFLRNIYNLINVIIIRLFWFIFDNIS